MMKEAREYKIRWIMSDVCCEFCDKYYECPMNFECKKIKEIGDIIESIRDDDTDLGIE